MFGHVCRMDGSERLIKTVNSKVQWPGISEVVPIRNANDRDGRSWPPTSSKDMPLRDRFKSLLKQEKSCLAVNGTPSHSVTCHRPTVSRLADTNEHPLTGWYLDFPTPKGWEAELTKVSGYRRSSIQVLTPQLTAGVEQNSQPPTLNL